MTNFSKFRSQKFRFHAMFDWSIAVSQRENMRFLTFFNRPHFFTQIFSTLIRFPSVHFIFIGTNLRLNILFTPHYSTFNKDKQDEFYYKGSNQNDATKGAQGRQYLVTITSFHQCTYILAVAFCPPLIRRLGSTWLTLLDITFQPVGMQFIHRQQW
jgi:hypothetical protein